MSHCIHNCQPDDIPRCAEIYSEVYSEPAYKENWSIEQAHPYLEKFFRMDPACCKVALMDGKIVGALFGYGYPWLGKPSFFLQELFVQQAYRHRGIAQALIRSLLEMAYTEASAGATVCLIANEQAPAVRLYAKLGLSQHETFKFYVGFVKRPQQDEKS